MWAPMCTIQWIYAVIMYNCNHWTDQTAVCFDKTLRSSSLCFSSAAAPCACHPKCDNFQLCIYELNTIWFIKYSTHGCYAYFSLHNLQLRFHLTKVFVIHFSFFVSFRLIFISIKLLSFIFFISNNFHLMLLVFFYGSHFSNFFLWWNKKYLFSDFSYVLLNKLFLKWISRLT